MKKMAKMWETMWFIQGHWSNGNPFFYAGGHGTRGQAIEHHCRMGGRDWAYYKRQGERAVKCRIVPIK